MDANESRRRTMSLLLAAVLAWAMTPPVPAEPVSVDALRWSKRVLVSFAPAADDERAARLDTALEAAACAVDERDLVPVRVPSSPDKDPPFDVMPSDAQALRERFDVAPDTFRVVLIGKDGGEKLRLDEVPDLDAVFALIDGMPMRRAEIRERAAHCPS